VDPAPEVGVGVGRESRVVDESERRWGGRVGSPFGIESGDVATFFVDGDDDIGTGLAELAAHEGDLGVVDDVLSEQQHSAEPSTHKVEQPCRRLGAVEEPNSNGEPAILRGHHPLTAPAVSPPATRFCTSRKKITTGIAISVEPAITPPQSVPRAPSLNACSHTGNVCFSGRFMMTRAKMNSFHAWMNAKIPVATKPGATSGRVIVMNARSRDDPSIIDAPELLGHVRDEAAQRPDVNINEREVGQLRPAMS
jgi:hypothetical protein